MRWDKHRSHDFEMTGRSASGNVPLERKCSHLASNERSISLKYSNFSIERATTDNTSFLERRFIQESLSAFTVYGSLAQILCKLHFYTVCFHKQCQEVHKRFANDRFPPDGTGLDLPAQQKLLDDPRCPAYTFCRITSKFTLWCHLNAFYREKENAPIHPMPFDDIEHHERESLFIRFGFVLRVNQSNKLNCSLPGSVMFPPTISSCFNSLISTSPEINGASKRCFL